MAKKSKIKYTNEPLEMEVVEDFLPGGEEIRSHLSGGEKMNLFGSANPDRKRRWLWIGWSVLLLAAGAALGVFAGLHLQLHNHKQERPAPPFPPVSLRIVFCCDSKPDGIDCGVYSGTARYTFSNPCPYPVTLAFPPICYYTCGENYQESPFPDVKDRMLPEFAQKRRELVIPVGRSITFDAKLNIVTTVKGPPRMNKAFVFGMPPSPCEYPVLGTIYAPVEYVESPETKNLTPP